MFCVSGFSQVRILTVKSTADFRICKPSEAVICVKSVCLSGVFGESVSVMEGDSVTLYTDLTEIHEDDDILWKYGAEKFQIAKMKKKKQIFSTFDGPDGRFRDRLKLDNQTGSLTITNITTQHNGVYQLQTAGAKKSSKTFSVSVYGEYRAGIGSICPRKPLTDTFSDNQHSKHSLNTESITQIHYISPH